MKGGKMKGYRFVTNDLKSEHENIQWEIGKWQKCKGKLSLCECGFHASEKPIDSINYISGTRWFECEAKGKILKDRDKFCASEMRLTQEIPNKVLRQFAIDCARRILHIFEEKYPIDTRPRRALEAARTYLQNPCEENRLTLVNASYASYAATHAARAAYVSYDAANAAANAANAANAAYALYVAYDAERKWQNRHLLNLIRKGGGQISEMKTVKEFYPPQDGKHYVICGNCADDLRAEEDAIIGAAQVEAEAMDRQAYEDEQRREEYGEDIE